MPEYQFTSNWWNEDHKENFNKIKNNLYGVAGVRALEIGTYEGRAATWLLDNALTGIGSRLDCIDPHPQPNCFLNLADHKNVFIFKNHSSEVLPFLFAEGIKYDLIYIDGDHNAYGVLKDIVMAWQLLKVGGFFLIDDYELEPTDPYFYESHEFFERYDRINFTHPRVAIDAFLTMYRGQFDYFANNYQIGVVKKVEMDKNDLPESKQSIIEMIRKEIVRSDP